MFSLFKKLFLETIVKHFYFYKTLKNNSFVLELKNNFVNQDSKNTVKQVLCFSETCCQKLFLSLKKKKILKTSFRKRVQTLIF